MKLIMENWRKYLNELHYTPKKFGPCDCKPCYEWYEYDKNHPKGRDVNEEWRIKRQKAEDAGCFKYGLEPGGKCWKYFKAYRDCRETQDTYNCDPCKEIS